jgi:hypothetical protein
MASEYQMSIQMAHLIMLQVSFYIRKKCAKSRMFRIQVFGFQMITVNVLSQKRIKQAFLISPNKTRPVSKRILDCSTGLLPLIQKI